MSKGKVIFYSILVMIAGIVFIVLGTGKVTAMSKDPIDLFNPDLDWRHLQTGQHVSGVIKSLPGDYMYITKSGKKSTSSDTSRVYLMFSADEERLMGVFVKGDYSPYDTLADETEKKDKNSSYKIDSSRYIAIDGVTRAMTSDEQKYLKDTLRQSFGIYSSLLGLTADDINGIINDYFVPITVVQTSMLRESLMLIIGILAIVITLIVMVVLLKECENAAKEEEAAFNRTYYGNPYGVGNQGAAQGGAYGGGVPGGTYGMGNQGAAQGGAYGGGVPGGTFGMENQGAAQGGAYGGGVPGGTYGMGNQGAAQGGAYGGGVPGGTYGMSSQGANGSAPAPRPVSGPGSYDSEGSDDFGTFGMNNYNPGSGTPTAGFSFGESDNSAGASQWSQPSLQPQENVQPQDAAQPRQNQPDSNFASFGRTNSEFIDFSTFKSSYNQASDAAEKQNDSVSTDAAEDKGQDSNGFGF